MAQMTGQNGVDGVAQIAFDLLLHQRCRYCQERETLDERQRLYQRQPGLLLTCQRVVTDRRIAVEFGDDLLPPSLNESRSDVTCTCPPAG